MISQKKKKNPTNPPKPHLLIFMMFNKYLRAATGVKSITHQLSSHHHPALPASEGPIAPRGVVLSSAGPTSAGTSQSPRPMQKQQEFSTSVETRFSTSVGWGFGTLGGLVDLAEALQIGEEDWHTRSMSHEWQLMLWGKERSQGGQEPPREGECQPSCPGGRRWPGAVWFRGRLTLPVMLSWDKTQHVSSRHRRTWVAEAMGLRGWQRGAWPLWV